MRTLLLTFVLVGCATDPASGALLPDDAHFTGVPTRFATVEDCLAQSMRPDKWDCTFELALCHTGAAGLLFGDVVTEGGYHLEGQLAVGTFAGEAFKFDVATGTELVAPNGNTLSWVPDETRWMTLQWSTIDCTRPPK